MRLCARNGLSARARPWFRDDGKEPLVQLRCGGQFYMLEIAEARKLAADLVESADEAEAGSPEQ
jgi:hypothetical protein